MLVRPPGFAPCSACHLRSFAPMARARAGIPFGSRSLPQAFHMKCLCASGEAVGMPFADKLAVARPSAVVSRLAGSAGRGRVGRKMAPMTKSAARLGVGGGRRFSPPAIMLVGEAARRAGAALRLSWESIRVQAALPTARQCPAARLRHTMCCKNVGLAVFGGLRSRPTLLPEDRRGVIPVRVLSPPRNAPPDRAGTAKPAFLQHIGWRSLLNRD